MKKMILGTSLSAVLLLMSGCGSGSDDGTNFSDVSVEYKTTATYDLSQYALPAVTQTSSYIKREYTNDQGEKKYDATADEEYFPVVNYEVNGSTVYEYEGGELSSTSVISADRITDTDAEDNVATVLARFAEKGDYIVKSSVVVNDEGISVPIETYCKLDNHHASKTVNNNTYEDILEVTCVASSSASGTINTVSYSTESDTEINSFFAKDKGLIFEVTETCSTNTIGQSVTKECEKTVQEITHIL